MEWMWESIYAERRDSGNAVSTKTEDDTDVMDKDNYASVFGIGNKEIRSNMETKIQSYA